MEHQVGILKKRHHPLPPHPHLPNHHPPNWNPNLWHWDSHNFLAKPLNLDDDHHQTLTLNLAHQNQHQNLHQNQTFSSPPNKRLRSQSPPAASTYPRCQVDNCTQDLSIAKDYHRRHKVCHVHSKSPKALVGNLLQRFCQQCSRFHPLSEFDEGKRSCRRRLAGHNRRRRKTQPDDVTSRLIAPGNLDNHGGKNIDIVNLLTVLARAQGTLGKNEEDKTSHSPSSLPGSNQLIQILSKINSLPLPADLANKLPILESLSGRLDQNDSSKRPNQSDYSKHPNQSDSSNRFDQNVSSPSTMDLLTVLSDTLAESAPRGVTGLSQRGSQINGGEKPISHKSPNIDFTSVQRDSSTSYQTQSPVDDSDCLVQETRVNLPFQLFSSSPENDSPPKFASAGKYLSSDSSNPMEDGSPLSSPVQLFPLTTSKEVAKPDRLRREVNTEVEVSRTHGSVASLELYGRSNTGAGMGTFQRFPYQAGYSSSSGSDHSPSIMSSDSQDRTGRILFKLFDKDPSQFPGALRTQIFNWLSSSPSDMESYIRPGCVVLSVYVLLSPDYWKQLEENLVPRVRSLVQDMSSEYWRSGAFSVHTGRQLVSHRNGKIRICKSWRTSKDPELILVTPLAVVAGLETPLTLRGRNLINAGTKIHCTYMGGYTSKEVLGCTSNKATYDEISLDSLKIDVASSSSGTYGRLFIEVENGFKGNSFPVIIAGTHICMELRLLETELDEHTKIVDAHNGSSTRSREEVLHFLNELGWLFQRRRKMPSILNIPVFSLARFKYLLAFSVGRDYCSLVKELLDILVEGNIDGDYLSVHTMEMLSEAHLLNRAVKRKCRKMVDLLINYYIISHADDSKKFIFLPSCLGPGGITPLHLAASTSGSDEMVDCLTNDPLKIGLSCWNTLLDASGKSPYEYAASRNNHSYNTLVAQKLSDRRNGQVSVLIEEEQQPRQRILKQGSGSCTKCSAAAAKYQRRKSGTQGLFHGSFVHSMLAVAAVCVCVCIFYRGFPETGLVSPLDWKNLDFGAS